MRCLPSSICFRADLFSKKVNPWKLPQNRRFYFEFLPFGSPIYVNGHDICQRIWVQGVVLWRTCWGIHWELEEPIENLMGAYWKFEGNIVGTRENWKKSLIQHPPQLKRKKCKAPWVRAWAFPLAIWNFSSQKRSSPFLAWPIALTSPTFFCGIWWAHGQKNWNYEGSPK
jgi:hypothetical protein